MKKKQSGFTMIVLLITLLIIMILFVITLDKIYWVPKNSSNQNTELLEDASINPNLANPQSQVDAVREKMKNIQNQENKKLYDSINEGNK